MNKSNFILTGGYPLKTERLQELETAYAIFNSLGALAGNFTVISGCGLTGTVVGNGVVYINGELIEFREADGAGTPDVIIIEDPVMRAFKNGVIKQVHTIRYATFGTAATSWPWSDFERFDTLKSISARLLPPGTNPQLYCGLVADIPQGWFLCDGTNGTPPLQGQFIVGYDPANADYNAIGNQGGLDKVTPAGTLASANLNLTIPRDGWSSTGGSLGSATAGRLIVGSGNNENAESLESLRAAGQNQSISGNHTHPFTGAEQDNRPKYYTLAYIIYKG